MNGVNFVDRGRRLQSNHESLPLEPIQRKADHPKCVAVEERSYSSGRGKYVKMKQTLTDSFSAVSEPNFIANE